MANNTKQARREAEAKRILYKQNYEDRIVALFHNSVNVKNVDENSLPKRYLLKTLLHFGAIAYDPKTDLYLRFTKVGIDNYGLPEEYELIGYKGFVKRYNKDDVIILRANDEASPLYPYLEAQIEKLVDFDMAIEQNLNAIKTMTLVEVPDQATLFSLSNLNEARELGSAIAFVNKQANLDNSVKSYSTGAQYLIDKLQTARKEVWNETLNTIGISTAFIDKKERVQSIEVESNDTFANDCLNVLVDTFNHDAEFGGLSIRLEVNTTNIVETENNQNNDDLEV